MGILSTNSSGASNPKEYFDDLSSKITTLTADKLGYSNAAYPNDKTINDALNTLHSTKANTENPAFTGTPTAPTAALSANNAQIATTNFVQAAIGSKFPFIYYCTGKDDDLAIQNIINNFIENSTAMSMSLKIIGTMGLRENLQTLSNFAAPSGDYIPVHFNLSSDNSRGATVNLDFSDCIVPIIKKNVVFLRSVDSGINLENLHIKLEISEAVNAYAICISGNNTIRNCSIRINGSSPGSFCGIYIEQGCNKVSDCSIHIVSKESTACGIFAAGGYSMITRCLIRVINMDSGTATGIHIGSGKCMLFECRIIDQTSTSASYGVHVPNSCETATISIDSCHIFANKYGVFVEASVNTVDVRIVNNVISGPYDVYSTAATNTVRWYVMGNAFTKAGLLIDGTSLVSSKTGTAAIYFPLYGNKFSRPLSAD